MPKKKLKIKKGFFRPVHLQAAVLLIAYYFISNFIFVGSIAHSNISVSFLVPLTFGTLSTFVFLYLFSHEDFFHSIASLEGQEKGKEKKLLGKFGHYGNILACMLVSAVGGPIFLALTIRFLFSGKENRYLIAFISVLVPTIIMVSIAKGLIKLVI
jgi:hypothetical protein